MLDVHLTAGEREDLRSIAHSLREIASLLHDVVIGIAATAGTITQQIQGANMAITGVPAGGTGSFQVTWNGALAAGATNAWSTTDPAVGLVTNADGSVTITVPATEGATIGLSVSTTSSNGQTVTASATVPILPAVAAPATSGTINQTA